MTLEQAIFLVQAQKLTALIAWFLWLIASADILLSPKKHKRVKYALCIAVIALTVVRIIFEALSGFPIWESLLVIAGVIICIILVKTFPK